jgi:hypothetical protein
MLAIHRLRTKLFGFDIIDMSDRGWDGQSSQYATVV